MLDGFADQLVGVELDLVDGAVVDPTPERLELLAREVRLVERNLLGLAVVSRNGQVEVEHVDQRPDEVNDRLEYLGGGFGECPGLLGLLVGVGDCVVVVHVVVLDQVLVEGLGQSLLDDRLARWRLDRLAEEELGRRLTRPGRQGLGDFALEPGDEVGVGLVGDDRELVDVVDGDGVVHPLAVLVNGQAQPAPDLLATGDGVVALLEHAHDEHVGVVPAFTQRGVGEDEPNRFGERQQPLLVLEDQVVGIGVGRLSLVVAAPGHLAVDLVLGLLVDGEVPLVNLPHLVAAKVALVLLGRGVDSEFSEHFVTDRGVLLLEHARIVAEGVFTAVVTVLGNLIDEEQREHLDALAEQLTFLVQVSAHNLPNLDTPLLFFGDITIGELPGAHYVAIAQLDHVTIGIDLGDEQTLVGLDPVRHIVKVGAHVESFDLTLDPGCGLDLDLHPCARLRTLGDLDGIEVQVSRRSGEPLHRDATHRDLLHELLVVRVQRVQAVHLGVLDLVRGRVAQQHQCVESRQRF